MLTASLLAGGVSQPVRARWANIAVTGISMPLRFSMTRVRDDLQVTRTDYQGYVALLYFGYTFCPDGCSLTLSNLTQVLDRLDRQATQVRVVCVWSIRIVIHRRCSAFAPQIDALRGAPDDLAALARHFRLTYLRRAVSGRFCKIG
jgi:protein SCO1/2